MQVFFCFALITNLIVSALLVLGGSAVITAVTGMNVYAASMLIPISVLLYTASGGLKATFTTSYAHTVIIYVALCLFTFTVYAGSKDLGIGSIDRVSTLPARLLLMPCPFCITGCREHSDENEPADMKYAQGNTCELPQHAHGRARRVLCMCRCGTT